MSLSLRGYEADAADLTGPWLALDSAVTHAPIIDFLPELPARVLDVGAGVGCDAAWLAGMGHSVLAVEPVDALRRAGVDCTSGCDVAWMDDLLPDLSSVTALGQAFDLVKLTAVWAHLDPAQRARAMPVLAGLLAPGGSLILSVRHGWSPENRPVFEADPDTTVRLAKDEGLLLLHRARHESVQPMNRVRGVTWTWLVFRRPHAV